MLVVIKKSFFIEKLNNSGRRLAYNFGYDWIYFVNAAQFQDEPGKLLCILGKKSMHFAFVLLDSVLLSGRGPSHIGITALICGLWSGQGALNWWTDTAANVVFSTLEVARASAVVFPASLRLNDGQRNRSSLAVGP